ncbi:hypothetical protein OC834_001689 [Tilletia horrida]|nr:hypothetical protein OC834_001689 [Tilletia horrida]
MTNPSSHSAEQAMTAATLGVAAVFFGLAAYKSFFPLGISGSRSSDAHAHAKGDVARQDPPPGPKAPSASSVRVTYSTNRPEMTAHHRSARGERPTIRAGALLRLIDVVAGVSARRHAGNSCVTVSIDAVLFLSPVYVGELLHFDACVNRAFQSSMEIGVRIEKEDVSTGQRMYVAHSYLTFVALPRVQTSPGDGQGVFSLKPAAGVRVGSQAPTNKDGARPAPHPRVKLAPISPTNVLEARRHLLAGRRREARMRAAKAAASADISPSGVSSALRDEIRYMMPVGPSSARGHPASGEAMSSKSAQDEQAQTVEMIELELVTRAVAASDPSVRIEPASSSLNQPAKVIVSLPGDEPIVHSLNEVQACAKQLGLRLPANGTDSPASPVDDRTGHFESSWTNWTRRLSTVDIDPLDQNAVKEIPVESTLVQSLNLVFPQHANSVSVLFGGQLAEWLEETALLSVRHVRPGLWHTVAMDGLPFKEGVAIGEVMICHAVVTDVWIPSTEGGSSLAEVLVIAEAEAPDGRRRVTNEALFTLRAEAGTAAPAMKKVRMPPGTELDRFAQGAARRRSARLEMGDMLVRLYSK